jgi:hypothetical protein
MVSLGTVFFWVWRGGRGCKRYLINSNVSELITFAIDTNRNAVRIPKSIVITESPMISAKDPSTYRYHFEISPGGCG